MIKLFHYSSKPYVKILSSRKSGNVNPKMLATAPYEVSKSGFIGAYIDSISVFHEPIPVNLPSLLGYKHEVWRKGTTIYEHLIVLDEDVDYSLVETTFDIDAMNATTWPKSRDERTKWFASTNKVKVELGLTGNTLTKLATAIKENCVPLDKAYTAKNRVSDSESKQRYATGVPHIMLYPSSGELRVASVKAIELT